MYPQTIEQYQGVIFRVDTVSGDDSNTGSNWTDDALQTVNYALNLCVSERGDRIYIKGNALEQIVVNKNAVALVFLGGYVDPGAGNIGIDIPAVFSFVLSAIVASGAIGIRINETQNATIQQALIYGLDADGIGIYLKPPTGLFPFLAWNNNILNAMVVGANRDEIGYQLGDVGAIPHWLDRCIATEVGTGIHFLAGAPEGVLQNLITHFGFHNCAQDITRVDNNHHWYLAECYFSDNPDATGDGFGDIIPFPPNALHPDYHPLGKLVGWRSEMMASKDDLAKEGADGDTLETISGQIDTLQQGSGSEAVTIYAKETSTENPIPEADYEIWDEGNSIRLHSGGDLDNNGNQDFNLNPGDYKVKLRKSFWNFPVVTDLVVPTGGVNLIIHGERLLPSSPSVPGLTVIYGYTYGINRRKLPGATISAKLTDPSAFADSLKIAKMTNSTVSNSEGYFELELIPNSDYKPTGTQYIFIVTKKEYRWEQKGTVPDQPSIEFKNIVDC